MYIIVGQIIPFVGRPSRRIADTLLCAIFHYLLSLSYLLLICIACLFCCVRRVSNIYGCIHYCSLCAVVSGSSRSFLHIADVPKNQEVSVEYILSLFRGMVVSCRLDTAYYSPILDIFQHQSIHNCGTVRFVHRILLLSGYVASTVSIVGLQSCRSSTSLQGVCCVVIQ